MHSALKDPAYFDGCLAGADALARFLCMHDGFAADLAECSPARMVECIPAPAP